LIAPESCHEILERPEVEELQKTVAFVDFSHSLIRFVKLNSQLVVVVPRFHVNCCVG
jgi:hypothetical protein